jgi:hypothetical protein
MDEADVFHRVSRADDERHVEFFTRQVPGFFAGHGLLRPTVRENCNRPPSSGP